MSPVVSFAEQSEKPKLQQMDPCMGLMMPMLFEMGSEVIYLFHG